MRFNSLVFVVFLLAVLAVLWLLPERARKWWLLSTSYIFYGSWHWPYLLLMIGTVSVAYFGARWIDLVDDHRRMKRMWSVVCSLLVLLFLFKYLDWTTSMTNGLLGLVGISMQFPLPQWVLPLGISFYCFEAISYTVDVAKKEEKVHGFWDLQLFIAFFPHLIAGPIMRAREFLPQLFERRRLTPDDIIEGTQRIASGMFLKIVLADGLAKEMDRAFARSTDTLGALDVVMMGAGFGLQVYFDFASYSRIALGAGQLCGITLVQNFNFPFSSKNPMEFWNRWHMSLSHWIRDYLFLPLMGDDLGIKSMVRATIISMAICGVWHGAGWHYLAFGTYHGVLIAAYHVHLYRKQEKARAAGLRAAPRTKPGLLASALSIASMTALLIPGWIFFRARDIGHAGELLWNAFTLESGRVISGTAYLQVALLYLLVWVAPHVSAQWNRAMDALARRARMAPLGWISSGGVTATMLAISAIYFDTNSTFIYFQF